MLITLFLNFFYTDTLSAHHRREHNNLHLFKGITLTCEALANSKTYDIFIIWLIFIGGWALFLQFLPTFLIIHFHYTIHSVGPMLAFMGGTFASTQIFISRRFLRVF